MAQLARATDEVTGVLQLRALRESHIWEEKVGILFSS